VDPTVVLGCLFFNRDAVGARNILRCLTSDERPKSLVRVCTSGRADITTFDYWS